MLLEFKIKNFKSFKEETSFKMIPAPKIKDLEYSLISKKVKGNIIKALPVAVIYGPNASGKTNIISAMDVFRSIILKGNIKNNEAYTTPNTAVDRLELIPNIESKENETVDFYIKFTTKKLLIEMDLKIGLGKFLQEEYSRSILNEKLKINNQEIYNRNSNIVEIGKINEISKYLIKCFSKDVLEKISNANLDKQELFFNGIFKTLCSKEIYDIINNWFENDFKIVYRSDKIQSFPISDVKDKGKKYFVDKMLDLAGKDFGITSTNIAYPIKEDKNDIEPLSLIKLENGKAGAVIPATIFESFGTIRFLNIFPMIVSTIKNGATLVMDEMDASIHPMAIMNIINIFNNDEINKNGAQLIFNTHNPIFLNNNLLRRDEIKFVEKNEKGSVHYSLSDFGTSGKAGVRNTEDYMKNYFISKYGAIENIDFSNVFEELEKEENKDEEDL